MKNKLKILMSILLIFIIIFALTLAFKTKIKVITKDEISGEIKYYSIYSKAYKREIDEFVSDEIEIYMGDNNVFRSYISDDGVLNKLKKTELKDSDGNIVENNETIIGIFQAAEKLKHDIWEFQVLKVEDQYFALVKLNVNWQSPCDLYKYDKDTKSLDLIYGFQSLDIIGILIPKE